MKRMFAILIVLLGLSIRGTGVCAQVTDAADAEPEDYKLLREIISTEFSGQVPHEWGEAVSGVRTRLRTDDKIVAIGVDACDLMAKGDDAKLIKFLAAENIPATLFLCGKWVDKYPAVLKKLAVNPLFEIANQGVARKACSVNGQAAAGTPGTTGVEDVFDEIEMNARKIEAVTGTLPHYYHAGAGYYDEIAVRIVKALGYEALGSSVLLPDGKAAGREQVLEAFLDPAPGAIAIFGGVSLQSTFVEGAIESVRGLRAKGYKFVKVSDFPPG